MSLAKNKDSTHGAQASQEVAAQLRARNDKATHQAIIKIHQPDGRMLELPIDVLDHYAPGFRKAVLLIEDTTSDSDRCRAILHELGYDGIQVIASLQLAMDYLDDVINNLTYAPDAIVLDLSLGYDSGFEVLRRCHAHPMLAEVPILVWCRSAQSHTEALSTRLGAKDFLVKTQDTGKLRTALRTLLEK